MKVFKLIFKNLLRHKLRSALTVLGLAVAVMSFGLIRTVIGAWNVGLEATSPNRLITRHSVSFIFPLPVAYKERIASVPGVTGVSFATWFQGVYIDERNFFPRMAVDAETFFDLYPELLVPQEDLDAFKKRRNACLVGVKTARKFNLKPGDVMTIDGDIFPGRYEFVVQGVYTGRDRATDETQMFFHWQYLEELLKRDMPVRAGVVGWYVVQIAEPSQSAQISQSVDALFRNSPNETKTETEKAFTQGFISMTSTIILAMEFISYIIIGIILLVLANTMVMTARERVVEYAVLKTLGFRALHIAGLITGESLLIAALGGMSGLLLTFPITHAIAEALSNFFPVFLIETETMVLAMTFAMVVGIIASILPVYRAMNTSIVEGLRHIG
ncbi:MAG: FtsX-like permease family protein [Ignavibacteriae bacterium]|nr:FtsX-like permease family protein [Ignavibacteriota bacterium]